MSNKNFQVFFDCGFSKVRAGIFNKDNKKEAFYAESQTFTDHSNLELEIKKMIISFEKVTNKYIDNINLMIDSPKMLSIGISISKKLDGLKLTKANIQFLIQDAKKQILKHYTNHNIVHIIINNYKIDNFNYSYLPNEIKCDFISLDILFICLPRNLILYFKNIFSKSSILINQIICTSYAKSINYKNNLNLTGYVSFIDVGFNKTSIISYYNDNIISIDVLPIGGNNITKDISKILGLDLKQAEQLKLNFDPNSEFLNDKNISLDELKKVIFSRTQEIMELCSTFIKSDWFTNREFKMLLMGEGSKIMEFQCKDEVYCTNDIEFLEETTSSICQSGFKFGLGRNKQEVMLIPKKQIKQGFFEKLFLYFG